MITKSILDTSKFLNNTKCKSTIDPRRMIDKSEFEEEEQENYTNDSHSYEKSYLTSTDKENRMNIKDLSQELGVLQKEHTGLSEDFKQLN